MEARKDLLNKDQVLEIFNKEFDEEYEAFEENIRTVARGNTGLANTWTDYLGLGGISAGTILSNATFAILAGLHIISPFITLGTGVVISAAGVIGAVAFRKARLKYKRQQYTDAEDFIETELYEEKREEFRQTLFKNLYPALKDCDHGRINLIVKDVIAAIANLILNNKIETFEQLNDTNFSDLLRESTELSTGFALNTKLIMSVIEKIDAEKQEQQEDAFDVEGIAQILEAGAEDCVYKAQASYFSLGSVATLFSSKTQSQPSVNAEEQLENTNNENVDLEKQQNDKSIVFN